MLGTIDFSCLWIPITLKIRWRFRPDIWMHLASFNDSWCTGVFLQFFKVALFLGRKRNGCRSIHAGGICAGEKTGVAEREFGESEHGGLYLIPSYMQVMVHYSSLEKWIRVCGLLRLECLIVD